MDLRGNDPHHPRDNIMAGTYYLRLMYDCFGCPGLFGAYNVGPARYSAYLAGRSRLPGETRAYMASVTGRTTMTRPTRQRPPGSQPSIGRPAGYSLPSARTGSRRTNSKA